MDRVALGAEPRAAAMWGLSTKAACPDTQRCGCSNLHFSAPKRAFIHRRTCLGGIFAPIFQRITVLVIEVAGLDRQIVDRARGKLASDTVDLAADPAEAVGQRLVGRVPAGGRLGPQVGGDRGIRADQSGQVVADQLANLPRARLVLANPVELEAQRVELQRWFSSHSSVLPTMERSEPCASWLCSGTARRG